MKKILLKDKRGMLDDLFDLFFTVLGGLFLLFFIGAVVNGSLDKGEELSLMGAGDTGAKIDLMGYLNHLAPGKGMTFAELIVQAEDDKVLKNELKKLTEEYLNSLGKPSFVKVIIIYGMGTDHRNIFRIGPYSPSESVALHYKKTKEAAQYSTPYPASVSLLSLKGEEIRVQNFI